MAVYQDRRGALWVGTQHGLYMFDGGDVTQFSRRPESTAVLPVSDVRGLAEDNHGNLLIATFGGGIYRLNQSLQSFDPVIFKRAEQFQFIHQFYSVGTDYFVLVGKNSVAILDSNLKETKVQLEIESSDEGATRIVGAVSHNQDGLIYATQTDIWLQSPDESTLQRLYRSVGNETITSMNSNKDGEIYLTTSLNDLLKISMMTGEVSRKISIGETSMMNITDLEFYSGYIWIGTDRGLIYVDNEFLEAKFFDTKNTDLFNNHISYLYKAKNILWIGTYQGLNILHLSPFKTYNEKTGSPFTDTFSFTESEDNEIYVGTSDGLYRISDDSETSTENPLIQKIWNSERPVMAISSYLDETWLGLWRGGVLYFEGDLAKPKQPLLPTFDELAVTSIVHSKSTGTWIATYNGGLFRIDRDTQKISRYMNRNAFTLLILTINEDLFAVSGEDLYMYRKDIDQFSKLEVSFDSTSANPMILSAAEAASGEILLGTKDHGIFSFGPVQSGSEHFHVRRLNNDPFLSHLTINAIEIDNDGKIWCATQIGIYRFSRSGEFEASFTQAHGLQGDDYNSGSSFQDSRGNIYFGGPKGYTKFLPKDVIIEKSPSNIVLTRLEILGGEIEQYHDVSVMEKLILSHNNYLVIFAFAIQDYIDTAKHHYRYKLQGFDPEWIDNGSRNTATYTNLPAGDYVFRVQGANSAGIWNEDGINLRVKVLPPPWQTWWAYCLYAILAVIGLWLVRRVYDNYALKERALAMAADMVATTHRVEDELQEQQESGDERVKEAFEHNLAILQLLEDGVLPRHDTGAEGLPSIRRVLEVLSALEQGYYDKPEGLVADLNEYTDRVISKLLSHTQGITTINAVTHTRIPARVASPIALVLFELLENALLHAFDGSSPANFVEIELTCDDHPDGPCYTLTVKDDGVGLPSDIDPDSPTTPGFGLIQRLVVYTGGSFSIMSGDGTTAVFRVPGD
jgi:ligand-binding sensor domain-containing protein/two-component sensor histidine kinase